MISSFTVPSLKDGNRAALLLALVLNVLFFPFIWGDKTFLESARTQPSIMPNGAWSGNSPNPDMVRTFDAADAWLVEPWAPLVKQEYFTARVPPALEPVPGVWRATSRQHAIASLLPSNDCLLCASKPENF